MAEWIGDEPPMATGKALSADLRMRCTHASCEGVATKIIARAMTGPVFYVAPYCDNHAAEVETEHRGRPACGPALSKAASKIEGRR